MPRLTRRSLAAAKEEPAPEESSRSTSRGRRSTPKKEEPKAEDVSIGEPQDVTPKRNSRQTASASKAKEPEIEAPASRGRGAAKGRSSARGKAKDTAEEEEKEVEEEASVEENEKEEEPEEKPTGRGSRSRGKGKAVAKSEPSPAGRSSSRGTRGRGAKKDEEQEEEEVAAEKEEQSKEEEVAVKGRGSRARGKAKPEATPSPRGNRSSRRGKQAEEEKEEVKEEEKIETDDSEEVQSKKESPVKTPEKQKTTPQKADSKKETPSKDEEAVEKMEEEENSTPEVPPKEDEIKKQDQVLDKEEKLPESSEEPMETEGTSRKPQSTSPNKKRKLEEETEDESASKRTKTEEANEAGEELSDYVIVNKEDVPNADSKEVQECVPKLPPVSEASEPAPPSSTTEPEPTPSEAAVPPVIEESPVVVPLTEAELAKQYTQSHMDRDETSSTLVEVGSEGATDITGMSVRSLDMSDAVSMDSTSTTTDDASNTSGFLPPSTAPKLAGPAITSTPVTASATPAPVVPEVPADISTDPPQQNNVPPSSSSPLLPPADSQNNGQIDHQQQNSETDMVQQDSEPEKSQQNSEPEKSQQNMEPEPEMSQQKSEPEPEKSQQNSTPEPPESAKIEKSVPHPVMSSTPAHAPPQNADNTSNGIGSTRGQVDIAQKSTPETIPVTSPVKTTPALPSSTAIDCRKFVLNPSFPLELMDPAFCFSVVSYNILAECHWKRSDYSYTSPQYMALDHRHALMLKELDYLDGDIVCMQEVEPKYYQERLLPDMTARGYSGWFVKRTKDYWDEGEATFVKSSRFRVKSAEGISLKELAYKEVDESGLSPEVSAAAKEYLDRADVIMLTQLECIKTGKTLTVANIHVVYAPPAPDVQCIQVACSIKQLVSKAGNDLSPHIICGDFNSQVTSAGYQLAKDGYLSDDHIRRLQAVEALTNTDGSPRSLIHHMWRAFQHTSSNLKSAYEVTLGKEPSVTTCTKSQKLKCLDYVFFSSASLDTVGVMETLDDSVPEVVAGLPSVNIPSDHLSLKAVFRMK